MMKVFRYHSVVCDQAMSAKRLGIRIIVIGMTTSPNVRQMLADIASSALDFYGIDNFRNYNELPQQLAREICGRLRQF